MMVSSFVLSSEKDENQRKHDEMPLAVPSLGGYSGDDDDAVKKVISLIMNNTFRRCDAMIDL
jgi:hypothetical protein